MVYGIVESHVVAVTAIIGILAATKFVRFRMRKARIQVKIAKKLSAFKDEQWVLEQHLLRYEEEDGNKWAKILRLDFKELQADLRYGKISAVDTLRAYQKAALKLNNEINCCTHFIEDSEELARQRDKTPMEERGPLHGIPISVKDCFFVKGCDVTGGMIQHIFGPCEKDGNTVRMAKRLGGVPFCLTSVPQSMMTIQCSNPIFGATGNPYNPDKECGGSSGGEGAIVGGGASILGLGNDIGGSIRCPPALCGAYSLKPTRGRHISQLGVRSPFPATNLVLKVSSGFVSSSVYGLTESFKAAWNDPFLAYEDKEVVPLKWREDIFLDKRKMRIGFYTTDKYWDVHPGMKRAVLYAKDCLEKAGHTVVPYDSPDIYEIVKYYGGFIYSDNFNAFADMCRREVLIDGCIRGAYVTSILLRYLPKVLLEYGVNGLLSLFTKLRIYPSFDKVPILTQKSHDMHTFCQEYVEKMNEDEIDLLLVPGSLIPAPDKGFLGKIPSSITPYCPWNLFDFPAGVVPMTTVTQDDEDRMYRELPNNDLVYRNMKKACKGSIGLPLSVQIVGRRFDEERVLRAMFDLEKHSGFEVKKSTL